MKKNKKFMLGTVAILSLAIPTTTISCKYTKKRKSITDKIDELLNNKKDSEGKEIEDSSFVAKLKNEVAAQMIYDTIQRVRENNIGSLDGDILLNGLQQLEDASKLATLIANSINEKLNLEIYKNIDILKKLKNDDFAKYKEYVKYEISKIKELIVQKFSDVNNLLKGENPITFDNAKNLIENHEREFLEIIKKLFSLSEIMNKLYDEWRKAPLLLEKIENDKSNKYENVKEQYLITYKFVGYFLKTLDQKDIFQTAKNLYETLQKYGDLIK